MNGQNHLEHLGTEYDHHTDTHYLTDGDLNKVESMSGSSLVTGGVSDSDMDGPANNQGRGDSHFGGSDNHGRNDNHNGGSDNRGRSDNSDNRGRSDNHIVDYDGPGVCCWEGC